VDSLEVDLLRQMTRVRRVEETIAELYGEQEMRCPVHLSIGQEAIAVGVCSALHKRDVVVSAHRSHAHYLAKGCDLTSMLCELYGKKDGCAGGKGGSMHLVDMENGQLAAVPIVGSAIPIGEGAAYGYKLQSEERLVVIFLGDGATEEGVFSESLDFASLHGLRVIFVVENNLYSVYTPLGLRQSSDRSITRIAQGHGVRAFSGDGNDVLEVFNAAHQVNEYATENNAPALIEFSTYRWLEHCGPNWDDELGYREDGELDRWMSKCPIRNLQNNLIEQGMLDKDVLALMESEIQQEIDLAIDHAKRADFPDAPALFTHVYG